MSARLESAAWKGRPSSTIDRRPDALKSGILIMKLEDSEQAMAFKIGNGSKSDPRSEVFLPLTAFGPKDDGLALAIWTPRVPVLAKPQSFFGLALAFRSPVVVYAISDVGLDCRHANEETNQGEQGPWEASNRARRIVECTSPWL